MANATNNYTKWWWLRLDQMISWSVDEWKAFAALTAVWTAEAAFFAIMGLGFAIMFLPIGLAADFLVSFVIALIICFVGVRSRTFTLFPKTITKGDDAAATRLGGNVYLPTNKFWIKWSWWWTDPPPTQGTKAQAKARLA